jgi:cell division protease FtsH
MKTVLLSILLATAVGCSGEREVTYDSFLKRVGEGAVDSVRILEDHITAKEADGTLYTTTAPKDPHLVDDLLEGGVAIQVEKPNPIVQVIWHLLPIILLIAVMVYIHKKARGQGGGLVKPLELDDKKSSVRFDDVAGIDDCLADVKEVTAYLMWPERFQNMGGKMPKGVLLAGPPGTGKTLLAKAIAGEADVPFFSMSGSDFVEMFVGVGASRVRELFKTAKEAGKCVIFIDEIDAVGKKRNSSGTGGNDERDQTLNSLLVEMDGFTTDTGILIIAATNRPDMLDDALTRPGRFDRQIDVTLPDIIGREKILNVHVKGIKIAGDLDLREVARSTVGFSGADLANLCNEAALLAAREELEAVNNDAFYRAFEKIIMGTVRETNPMNRAEQEATAYHEAGHAIMGIHAYKHDPVHKVSIMPRGRALGVTVYIPERDSFGVGKRQLVERCATLYAGRCAEELIYGMDDVSTGASNDMERATEIITNMVTKWGFNDSVGRLVVNVENQYGMKSAGSDEQSRNIDMEIRKLSDDTYNMAMDCLMENRDKLDLMTKALIKFETIDANQVARIMEGEDLAPDVVLGVSEE